MADNLKVLGQLAPSATTDTDLYTVPENTQTTVSSVAAVNRSGGALTFRVAVRPKGAAVENKHYIYYGKSVAANDTVFIIIGITLSDDDVISVYASSGDMSFSIFGVETS
jgi:hypothetical protein|tara:strand:- start:95 stop:424 length:330 start_codon:yes stop_codon:yes gene_type:complete